MVRSKPGVLIALLITLLIVGTCALVASTWHHFSITWDEPEHLAAGMQLVDRGVYPYDLQHPPLARIAMSLGPWLAGAHAYDEPGPSGEQSGRDLLYRSGHYDLYLNLARAGMLPFLAILLWATWAWARHLHGDTIALLATALLIATPPLLGHAGVAALDIPGAAMCTLACYCLLRWYEAQSWRWTWFAGISAGLAIATKLSALPFIALVGLAWLPFWWRNHYREVPLNWPRFAKQLSCMLVVALLCAIATYGPVGPQGLVLSIQDLLKHNHEGHLSYLLGRFSDHGFVQFYVVALAVKTPLPLLLLGVAGLVALVSTARTAGWRVAAPTIAFVVLLGFCSFYSRINIGLRHVFVLYPLLCIAAASFAVQLWQRHDNQWLRGALVVMIGWQMTLVYRAYPDYLSYFNFTAGQHPERILIDSDLDWSQDVERLRARLEQLKVKKFGFVYRGTIDVIGERLPGVWMAQPFQPAKGWIAASLYARDTVSQGEAYQWLKQYTPVERVGKSIDLYYIPEASIPGASIPETSALQPH